MGYVASTRVAGALVALGPLGCLFSLMMGHDGHLSRTPLLIGGIGGLLGLALRLVYRRTREEAL